MEMVWRAMAGDWIFGECDSVFCGDCVLDIDCDGDSGGH